MDELARWEGRFGVPEYIFGTAPNAFLAAHRHLLPQRGRALAIADGEGRNGVWLAQQGLDVLSIDFSPSAQAKARALALAQGVTMATDSSRSRALIGRGKLSRSWSTFSRSSPTRQSVREIRGIRRSLKPGGLLLLQGYRPEQLGYGTGGPRNAENITRVRCWSRNSPLSKASRSWNTMPRCGKAQPTSACRR